MKLITCPHCKADTIGPETEAWPQGGPVMMNRYVGSSDYPVIFKCHRCTNAVKIGAVAFNGLPAMTAAQQAKFAPSAQLAVD